MEKCENCDRTIGKLETPRLLDNHILCEECYGHLAARQQQPARAAPAHVSAAPSNQCPHCGAAGVIPGRGLVGSEVLVFFVLFWLLIIPAIVYYGIKDGKLYCPNCRRRV